MNFDKHMELIKIGLDKKRRKLTKPSWRDLGKQFHMDGEVARQIVKNYEEANGLLKGKHEAGREKILIFSDMHVPDHKREMILDLVSKNKDVDLIIIGGDILDCKAVSAWYDEEISILDHELIEAHAMLAQIREITPAKIVLVKGNHEQRVNTHYAKNAKAMGTGVVETEILYRLANGFEIKFKNQRQRVHYEPIENVHYCESRTYIHGDLVVNHPSTYRKDHMKTAQIMYQEKLRTKYPEGKVFVFGHTHQLGTAYADDGIMLIESGCTCKAMRYADQDDRPVKPQQRGYVYLEMKDGKADLDSIRISYLGSDVPEMQRYEEDEEEYADLP